MLLATIGPASGTEDAVETAERLLQRVEIAEFAGKLRRRNLADLTNAQGV